MGPYFIIKNFRTLVRKVTRRKETRDEVKILVVATSSWMKESGKVHTAVACWSEIFVYI